MPFKDAYRASSIFVTPKDHIVQIIIIHNLD